MNISSEEINKIDTQSLNIFHKDKRFALMMAKKDKVDFIYNTSALEGNTMTFPEVQTLLDGITVGGKKLSEEQQILNQNKSVNLLFSMIEENTFRVNKDTFLSLHNKVAFEEALRWGEFRQGGVNIGGTEYKPPLSAELDDIFHNGLIEIEKISNPIVRAITFFLFGAKNQFFYDGNKRTSRLIMNGILIENGCPILNIKAKDKLTFDKQMLNFYDGGDIVKSISFLIDYYIKENTHLVFEKKKPISVNTRIKP